DRRHPLVYVVQQLDLLAKPTAHVVEQSRHETAVGTWLPGLLLDSQMRGFAVGRWQDGRAIGRITGQGNLAAHVPIPLLDVAPGLVFHLGEIATRRVCVQRRRLSTLATHELI